MYKTYFKLLKYNISYLINNTLYTNNKAASIYYTTNYIKIPWLQSNPVNLFNEYLLKFVLN